jgi:dihydroorotate dehydrogenase (NAD+) catalytic subunit
MKTITLRPREGNYRWWKPWQTIRPIWENWKIVGSVNAFGLSNPGIDWWAREIGPKVDSSKIKLVGSIFGPPEDVAEMADIMNDFDLVAVELNISCPNDKGDVLSNTAMAMKSCEAVKKVCRHPMIVKLSVAHDFEEIVKALDGIAEALSINSVPWNIIFPGRRSPMARFGGGGVSGPVARPFTWAFLKELKAITSIPVIGPSAWYYEDFPGLRALGARAISFSSIFLFHPCWPTAYVRRDMNERSLLR